MQKSFGRSSWQKVAPWYNRITEHGQGHYYHQHVVIPGVLKLLDLKPNIPNTIYNILDLACGNGVLAKSLPKDVEYLGIDIAPALINEAKRTDHNPKHKYMVADITNLPNHLEDPERSRGTNLPKDFNAATLILALQNIPDPINLLQNASNLLIANGYLLIVLNHPAFRIPRQSSWGIDEGRKIQYRRVDKYMSPMNIPIRMNPSNPNSPNTLSYHYPLSDYSRMLKEAGFVIDLIEEWTSDKESEGRAARMENRSRSEIPLFLAIRAVKTESRR